MKKNKRNKKPITRIYSKPAYSSFEEFKAWFLDIGKSVGAGGEPPTDEELRETYNEFLESRK
ncbi:hypothetical protein ACFLXB_09070 [Chloroflexota bacterium]